MKEQFKDITFTGARADILAKAGGFIISARGQGYLVTLRQVYYYCIANDVFPASWMDADYNRKNGLSADTKNTMKNYKKFGELLNDAKLAGLVDWESVEDRTRDARRGNHRRLIQ